MTRRIYLAAAFVFLFSTAFAQHAGVTAVIDRLNESFKNREVKAMRPHLAPDFSVAAYMGTDALGSLQQVAEKYSLDSFILVKVTRQDSLSVANVKITGGKDTATLLYFNEQNQLVRGDLFDQLYGLDRHQPSKKVATIPFEVEDGSIYLTITLNENTRKLRFLFDTGSDGMMVSSDLGDSLGLKITREHEASVVGGNIDIKVSGDNTVHMSGFEFPRQSIAVFGSTNPQHDGIIGNTIAKKYITHVDYDKQEMTLYSPGKFEAPPAASRLPVETTTGNILLNAEVLMPNDHKVPGKFTFDTGAGYHIIVFRPTVLKHRMLVSGFVQDSASSTISMGIATPVFHGKAKSLSLSPDWVIKDFPITLMGSSGATRDWKPEAAGSLGIRFIADYNFTINLVDKYIAFEKRG